MLPCSTHNRSFIRSGVIIPLKKPRGIASINIVSFLPHTCLSSVLLNGSPLLFLCIRLMPRSNSKNSPHESIKNRDLFRNAIPTTAWRIGRGGEDQRLHWLARVSWQLLTPITFSQCRLILNFQKGRHNYLRISERYNMLFLCPLRGAGNRVKLSSLAWKIEI
jgi:hypothetical protein